LLPWILAEIQPLRALNDAGNWLRNAGGKDEKSIRQSVE